MALPGAFRVGDGCILGVLLPRVENRRGLKGRAGGQAQSVAGGGLCVLVSSRATVWPGVAWNSDGWNGCSGFGIEEVSRGNRALLGLA